MKITGYQKRLKDFFLIDKLVYPTCRFHAKRNPFPLFVISQTFPCKKIHFSLLLMPFKLSIRDFRIYKRSKKINIFFVLWSLFLFLFLSSFLSLFLLLSISVIFAYSNLLSTLIFIEKRVYDISV